MTLTYEQPSQLRQLESTSLRVQARRVIRTSIIAGEIEEGTIYPISYFASILGVSSTPVREALLDLANAGLVEAVPNRGFRIPALSEHDLDEIFELRLLLEVPSIGRVALTRRDHEIQEFRLLANLIKGFAEDAAVAGFLVADRDFHHRLLQTLGNERLIEIVMRLRDQARLIGLSHLAKSGLLMSAVQEHDDLLCAIEEKDSRKAEAIMRRHLEHTRGIWAGRSESDNS